MENIEQILTAFSSSKKAPYMQFLSKNNKDKNTIDFNKIRDLCTAFEKEFGLSSLGVDKEMEELVKALKDTVNEFTQTHAIHDGTLSLINSAIGHLSNPLRKKMYIMYEYYEKLINVIFIYDSNYKKYKFTEEEFQKFVKIRNDITHVGSTVWSDNIGIIYRVVEAMVYLSSFERMGVDSNLVARILLSINR